MRRRKENGRLSVHASAGSYVTLLGIDMDEASTEGVLGFALERIDHTRDNRRDWLARFLPRIEVTQGQAGFYREHPIQSFNGATSPPAKTTSTPSSPFSSAPGAPAWRRRDRDQDGGRRPQGSTPSTSTAARRPARASLGVGGAVSELTPDDSWRTPYYWKGRVKQKEQLYFA